MHAATVAATELTVLVNLANFCGRLSFSVSVSSFSDSGQSLVFGFFNLLQSSSLHDLFFLPVDYISCR